MSAVFLMDIGHYDPTFIGENVAQLLGCNPKEFV
jgi:hypothetical protein